MRLTLTIVLALCGAAQTACAPATTECDPGEWRPCGCTQTFHAGGVQTCDPDGYWAFCDIGRPLACPASDGGTSR